MTKQKGPKEIDGYLFAPFEFLASFDYRLPEPELPDSKPVKPKPALPAPSVIPPEIRSLSGKKVAIKGFMIPIEVDSQGVSRFALVRNQMACCYGVTPQPNEWVYVVMSRGKKTETIMDQLITAFGTLRVSDTITEGGINSLYQLECERVKGPIE